MGKIKSGPMRGRSGKSEDLQVVYKYYRQTGTTVVQRLPPKPAVPIRYEKQMDRRCQVASVSTCYQPFKGRLFFPAEGESVGRKMFNDFMKYNVAAKQGCYLTQEQRKAGFQVLGNFIVSHGPVTLPSIEVIEQEDRFVTNLALGELEISPLTTQADFALALAAANPTLLRAARSERAKVRDSLTFLMAHQYISVGTVKPTIWVEAYQVPLFAYGDANSRPLSDLLPIDRLCATTVENPGATFRCLSLRKGEGYMLFTIVHSRRVGEGPTQCSTQMLAGSNPLREVFLTQETRAKAFLSYGGVNRVNPLDPLNSRPARFADPTPNDITALADWTPEE